MAQSGERPVFESMQAMVLERPRTPLVLKAIPIPEPVPGQVLIKVICCGVCRTDLHIVDGDLEHPALPLIPGHEVIGRVIKTGKEAHAFRQGDIVGVPWLGYTCGACSYCLRGQENLCEHALFTGYTINGGFAEYMTAYEAFCFPIAKQYQNPSGAPLLCAGLIGYRSYKFIGSQIKNLGFYGFGAAAHILIQIAKHEGKKVYAFTKEYDEPAQTLATNLGADWVGNSSQTPPEKLDAAIIFAPEGKLLPVALAQTNPGSTIVCGGIHMSDIPSFPYRLLWQERTVRSVANLTRNDAKEFLQLASSIPIRTDTTVYPLHLANEVLQKMREGNIHGAAVLVND
ncbi:MAG: zinc-dependent alcohol dehydrogenase family protein [Agriterribacter sp.]